MKTIVSSLFALSALAGTTLPCGTPASAHGWYPKECCSNHDCMPADEIATDIRGGRVVTVGQQRISVPRGFPVRSSPDDQIHICFRIISEPEEGVFAMPLCLFLPAES